MDYKYIEQLLDRYFECETTLEEEKILRTFFSQENVPARLFAYRDIFIAQKAECEIDVLGDDFDSRILAMVADEADKKEEEVPVHVKARVITLSKRLRPLYKAVAVVAVILTLGNAAQMPYERAAILDAERFAAQHAKDTATIQSQTKMAMNDSIKLDSIKNAARVILK